MEEIDIIELLKRVKEEKAPKRIEINGTKYEFNEDSEDVACIYREGYGNWLEIEAITLDTKIKILDKPVIEELEPLNAYKLMEAPYMAKLLKEQRYDEFMEHLKQSEVEIANKVIELIRASNKK